MTQTTNPLPHHQSEELLSILKARFQSNLRRHPSLTWHIVQAALEANPQALWSLYRMEQTGGEPDVVTCDGNAEQLLFFDCSAESPAGRRSLCYDGEALRSRKEHKPPTSAADLANEMGIELLTEEQYRQLQRVGEFDQKTSSWVLTPADIRSQGGALFCDRRYGRVFVYHNGAQSYYGARGFRGLLRVSALPSE